MTIADINTEARGLVDATTASYTDPLLLIRINTAIEELAAVGLEASGRWQYDDTNNTDYPDGVGVIGNLVSGTKSYLIDTSLIKVDGVSFLDVNGKWVRVLPFDADDLQIKYGQYFDRSQFLTTAGRPLYYDLHGNYLTFYPAPDNGVSVTLTNGLKVWGSRTAALFTSADVTTGTKVPGFPSPFHSLLSYKAALPYAMAYKPGRVAFLVSEIARKTADLKKFYAKRDTDDRPTMSMAPIRFR